jgi:bifunctional non-homologous end joining protein LigD
MDEPASLVWAANMAALELHVPMALAADLDTPRAVVFDFDPGAPAAMKECCEIALLVRDVLASVNLVGFAKTSGSKGLQLYVPLNTPCTHQQAADFALAAGQLLEHQHRDRVTTTMAKAVRPGKIFVDWSQNARFKTTIGVYSMRARPEPTCSTPVTWDEVAECAGGGAELRFLWREVLARVEKHGDLFEPVLKLQQTLPGGG